MCAIHFYDTFILQLFFNVKISQEVLVSQYGHAKDNDKTMLLKNS